MCYADKKINVHATRRTCWQQGLAKGKKMMERETGENFACPWKQNPILEPLFWRNLIKKGWWMREHVTSLGYFGLWIVPGEYQDLFISRLSEVSLYTYVWRERCKWKQPTNWTRYGLNENVSRTEHNSLAIWFFILSSRTAASYARAAIWPLEGLQTVGHSRKQIQPSRTLQTKTHLCKLYFCSRMPVTLLHTPFDGVYQQHPKMLRI